jgi:hypothetical protein
LGHSLSGGASREKSETNSNVKIPNGGDDGRGASLFVAWKCRSHHSEGDLRSFL